MPDGRVNYRNVLDEPEPWGRIAEYVKGHPDAFPLVSNRVSSLLRSDNFRGIKVVLRAEAF